jgi:PAS domain S-box-containing protein
VGFAPRELNRQLQFLSESFPDGILYQYTVTPDGQRLLTYLGRDAERIFGERPPSIPVDVEWLTARIVPEDNAAIDAASERSRRDLTRFNHDVRIRARDGTERWVSFRTQPRELEDGAIVWDGVILDVTERHQAEESVRRKLGFLATLNETTLELLGRRNVTDLLHALADRAALLLNCPHAEISLVEGAELVVHAYSKGREYLAGDRVGRDQPALSWRAIDTRQPVVADRYPEHPHSRQVYRARGVHAAATFPIVRGEICLGVLGVAREVPLQPFTADDIQEGVMLAQMAALVLHNAGVHEDAVRAADERTAALRESEERFRGVFDKSPIVIALLSVPDGRILEVNVAAEAAFGYTRDEVVGKTSVELDLWVDLKLREGYLNRLREVKTVSAFEAQMRRKNGEVFTVLYSGSLVMIGGRPYSLNMLQDITERKQSDAARNRSLALMRATLESTADGILAINGDGRIETYNRNFAEMWRINSPEPGDAPEEELLRTILDQLVEPEKFLTSLRDLYARSEDEVFDELLCKDGRIFERYSRPQLVEQQPAGRVWSFRDITTRRQADAALRESEERFRVLADVSPVGIFSSDPHGRCLFVNRRWCEIAGMSAEQAMGEGWKTALHPDDRRGVAENWSEAVRAGESSAAEFRFVRPDGAVTWLVGQSRAQHHADGTLAGYVGTITDVTTLKRAEDERKKIEAQLRQSRKMESLGTLAGGIAHDFNNILNGTFGFVDLARLELAAEHPAHPWLDRIAASSQRARELVRQILTFSRKNEAARVPQRLNGVVGDALRFLRSSLPAMVEIESHIAPETPAVLADATQIHQVVLNLCTNAWHAMPERGGRISVTLEPWIVSAADAAMQPELRPGACVRLTVADDGSGMDAATMDHIFEPFFTTKETGAGTGLGLAVVHGIVKSHDAAIVVRSTVGVGSVFEIYFPAVAHAPRIDPEEPVLKSRPAPRGHGERILVVDDDAVSGFAIEKTIESLGYTVTRITRPEEALARFTASPASFDLVVSDLAMPGMNGEELIEHLIKVRRDLPIIVVSGYVESARQRILARGAARGILRKPVTRDELGCAIAEHLREIRP